MPQADKIFYCPVFAAFRKSELKLWLIPSPRLIPNPNPNQARWLCDHCGRNWRVMTAPDCKQCDQAWRVIDAH